MPQLGRNKIAKPKSPCQGLRLIDMIQLIKYYPLKLPDGIAKFADFRNQDFAKQHPERIFKHVQGGLFIMRRAMYDEIGGFRAIPIMEDVDIMRRIGRNRFSILACDVVTSAERYRREGYIRRMLRNLTCLSMWFIGVPPERIVRIYN